jgi:Tfp pilus assembly protein PilF
MQLALQHHEAGRLPEAESICRSVLNAEPHNANAIYLLGVIAHQGGNHDGAVGLMERAIALKPGNPFFLNNLGEILRELNRPDAAEKQYRRALVLKPDFIKAHNNLGNALQALRRYDEAEQSYREAIRFGPALALPRLNCALLHLLRGDYGAGFAHYEQRFEGADPRQTVFMLNLLTRLEDTPRWQGEPLGSKRLLVWTEQGLGDCVMMMRYLPLLKSRGAGPVTVYCAAPLVRLMRTLGGIDEVISQEDALPEGGFDTHCPLMSLPLLFGTRLETVPREVPYVRVAKNLQRKWAAMLGVIPHPRVGLVWAGAKRNMGEARRSMRLQAFAPLLGASGASFVSLQKGEDAGELDAAQWSILDLMDECGDLLDTAALIKQLDLVVSIDTSVAHLAGALGKPVWLLTRGESAWQWMLERDDSPWYPTMRIFRQPQGGNWHDVMANVTAIFKTTFGAAAAGEYAARRHARTGNAKSLWAQLFLKRGK